MKVKYKTRYLKNVTPKDTQPFRSARLFVPGWAFSNWWVDPEIYMWNGAYISTMSCDDKLKGIAIINLDPSVILKAPKVTNYYETIGFLGFFVSRPYRGQGHAARMAKELEKKVLKTNPQYLERFRTPLVTCSGPSVIIGSSVFEYIKAKKIW